MSADRLTATCEVPVMWSIGQACSALCLTADDTGVEQRAMFNWIMLIARPGAEPTTLVRRYWRAVAGGTVCTADLPRLETFDPARAETAQMVGEAERRGLNALRVAA